MQFAVRPFGTTEQARIMHEALLWRVQPAFGQMDPTAAYVERATGAELSSLFSISGEAVLTTLKPSHDGTGVVLRLFNSFPAEQAVTLHWRCGGTLTPVRLDETAIGETRMTQTKEGVPLKIAARGFTNLLWCP